MTSQTLALESSTRASNSSTQAQSAEAIAVDRHRSRLIEAMKTQYQVDQQVKFLHLQAEADSLLQQLQALKCQRQASVASQPTDLS